MQPERPFGWLTVRGFVNVEQHRQGAAPFGGWITFAAELSMLHLSPLALVDAWQKGGPIFAPGFSWCKGGYRRGWIRDGSRQDGSQSKLRVISMNKDRRQPRRLCVWEVMNVEFDIVQLSVLLLVAMRTAVVVGARSCKTGGSIRWQGCSRRDLGWKLRRWEPPALCHQHPLISQLLFLCVCFFFTLSKPFLSVHFPWAVPSSGRLRLPWGKRSRSTPYRMFVGCGGGVRGRPWQRHKGGLSDRPVSRTSAIPDDPCRNGALAGLASRWRALACEILDCRWIRGRRLLG